MNKKYIEDNLLMRIGNTALLVENNYIYTFNMSNIKKYAKFKLFPNTYTIIGSTLSRADLYKSMLMIDRNIELIREANNATINNIKGV